MAYSKQTWNNGVTGGTPINADRLNHMEDGIENPVDSIPPGTYVKLGTASVQPATTSAADVLAAISAAPDAGVVDLPAGTYDLTTWVAHDPGKEVTIRGAGKGRTVITGNGQDFLRPTKGVKVVECDFRSWRSVVDLTDVTATVGRVAVNDSAFDDCSAGVLWTSGTTNVGVRTFRMIGNTWTNGRSTGSNRGFCVLGAGLCNKAVVAHNDIDGVSSRAIAIGYDGSPDNDANITNSVISNNVIRNATNTGTSSVMGILVYGRSATITGNVLDTISNPTSADVDGIYSKCRYATITGNSLYNAGGHEACINIKGSLRGTAASSQGYGIVCSGNTVFSSTAECKYGVNIATESVDLSGNRFEGLANRAIIFSASGSGDDINVCDNTIVNGAISTFGDGVSTSASTAFTSASAVFTAADVGAMIYSPGNYTFTDGNASTASTTFTSATAAFTADDVGSIVVSDDFPLFTTVESYTDASTVVLSDFPLVTSSAVTFSIERSSVIKSGSYIAAYVSPTQVTLSQPSVRTATNATFSLVRQSANFATNDGIRISGIGSRIYCRRNTIFGVNTHGIYCGKSNGASVEITDNIVIPIGTLSAPAAYGIRIDNSSVITRLRVKRNSVRRCKYGLRFTGTAPDDVHIIGNDFTQCLTSTVDITAVVPTNLVAYNNEGWTYDNRELLGVDLKLTGLTGAATAFRFVGYTNAAGAPVSGTFVANDVVVATDGLWRCTAGGSPGTWSQLAGTVGIDPGRLFVRKTADTTRSSATTGSTLTDDPDLHLALAANRVYTFVFFGFYDAATTGDFKTAFTVPAGATIIWHQISMTSSASSPASASMATSVVTASGTAGSAAGGAGAGTKCAYEARGLVVVGGTAGDLMLRWAQGAADAVDTTLFAGSHLFAYNEAAA